MINTLFREKFPSNGSRFKWLITFSFLAYKLENMFLCLDFWCFFTTCFPVDANMSIMCDRYMKDTTSSTMKDNTSSTMKNGNLVKIKSCENQELWKSRNW